MYEVWTRHGGLVALHERLEAARNHMRWLTGQGVFAFLKEGVFGNSCG